MKNYVFKLRVKFYYFRKSIKFNIIKSKILVCSFFENFNYLYLREIQFIKNYGVCIFPYEFTERYINRPVDLSWEEGYPYVEMENKKLFLRNGSNNDKLVSYYNDISCEQDLESPHRYCSGSFDVSKDDVLIDIGVAEGNFSLMNIDIAKYLILFERNPNWTLPLEKTFQNYSDKVTFYNKNVGSNDKVDMVLDKMNDLFEKDLFIKIDVDGAEKEVLDGMDKLLSQNQNIKVAICTYHKNNDADDFEKFFKSKGFLTEFSKGYMLFYFDKNLKFPYFRRGVLRASKVKILNDN